MSFKLLLAVTTSLPFNYRSSVAHVICNVIYSRIRNNPQDGRLASLALEPCLPPIESTPRNHWSFENLNVLLHSWGFELWKSNLSWFQCVRVNQLRFWVLHSLLDNFSSFKQNTIESTLTLVYLIISCLWDVKRWNLGTVCFPILKISETNEFCKF